jgi:CarD family transcriptional regulator
MQFSIGDKVMHPRFGAGEITGEEHRELVKGFEHYFVIKILATPGTAYVPTRKMNELGVRPVMSGIKHAEVLEMLQSVPRSLPKDYKERQGWVQEMLETGHPLPIAQAIRDLTYHGQVKHLTQKDESLLRQGRDRLATEMAVAGNLHVADAQEAIDAALRVAMASAPASL